MTKYTTFYFHKSTFVLSVVLPRSRMLIEKPNAGVHLTRVSACKASDRMLNVFLIAEKIYSFFRS